MFTEWREEEELTVALFEVLQDLITTKNNAGAGS